MFELVIRQMESVQSPTAAFDRNPQIEGASIVYKVGSTSRLLSMFDKKCKQTIPCGKSSLVFARLFLLPQHKGHPRHRHRQEKKMVKHMMVEDNDNNVLSYDGNGLTWQPRTIILTHCSGVKAHYLHRLPGSGYLLEFPFSVPNPHTRPA